MMKGEVKDIFMKETRRVISIFNKLGVIIAVILLMTCMVFIRNVLSFAETLNGSHGNDKSTDDMNFESEEMISILQDLGVYAHDLDNSSDYIKRQEFCMITYNLMKRTGQIKDSQEGGRLTLPKTSVFKDVDDKSPYYEAIYTLNQLGYISGTGKQAFSPLQSISQQEAVKILVDVLGDKNRAIASGGYPKGYLKVGVEEGLMDASHLNDECLKKPLDYQWAVSLLMAVYTHQNLEPICGDSSEIHLKDFQFNPLIQVRSMGKLEGELVSDDDIDWVRWRFIEPLTGKQIVASRQKMADSVKQIDFETLSQSIDFSRLGIGSYQLIIEVKTNKEVIPVFNRCVTVVSPPSKEEDEDINHADLQMKYLNISQGPGGQGGHKGTYAIDLAGIDEGQDAFYAPFDGTITKIYSEDNQQNFVWLESKNKIQYLDGHWDYVTLMTGHDENISDLYVGKEIHKGDHYYSEGASGKAIGNHIHLEVASGRTTSNGWCENEYGIWHIENMIPPQSVFYIPETTTIITLKDLVFEEEGE